MIGYDISLIPEISDRYTALCHRLAPTQSNTLHIESSSNVDGNSSSTSTAASNITMVSAETTFDTAAGTTVDEPMVVVEATNDLITSNDRHRTTAETPDTITDSGTNNSMEEQSRPIDNESRSSDGTNVMPSQSSSAASDRLQTSYLNPGFERDSDSHDGSSSEIPAQPYQMLMPGEIHIQQTHLHQAPYQKLGISTGPTLHTLTPQPNTGGTRDRNELGIISGMSGVPTSPHVENIEMQQAQVNNEQNSEGPANVILVQLPNPNQPAVEDVNTPLQTIRQISAPVRGYTEQDPTQAGPEGGGVQSEQRVDTVTPVPALTTRTISGRGDKYKATH